MMFIDAPMHLSDEEYAEDIDEVVAEAENSNVVALVKSIPYAKKNV